jgi:hypothetical protein
VLGWLFEVWKAYARRAGSYQTRVVLVAVYAVIVGPAARIGGVFGSRLLDIDRTPHSTWARRTGQSELKSLAALRRQF